MDIDEGTADGDEGGKEVGGMRGKRSWGYERSPWRGPSRVVGPWCALCRGGVGLLEGAESESRN